MAKKKIPKIVTSIQCQPKPTVDYSFQKNISYSQMSIYNACPGKWAFQYRDKLKSREFNMHFVFGTAMHEALQNYLDIMYKESAAEADRYDTEGFFKARFISEYQKDYKSNKDTHFSTPDEMREFHNDGIEIIKEFKKKRNKYFTKRNWHLVGCELPILVPPLPEYKNILYMGYLDVVMYNEVTNQFTIFDIKTSTKGWNKWAKADEDKHAQLVLYKRFFSEQYNIPINDVNVEFFIVKRKLPDYEVEYAISRIQSFKPASGKVKLNKANQQLDKFITEAFSTDAKILDKDFEYNPSKWNCRFCAFKEECENSID